jgi:hypothetical protein
MMNGAVTMKNVWRQRLRSGFALALAALREIFDENAYARFLHRHELARSRESYKSFLREQGARRERRPRCC